MDSLGMASAFARRLSGLSGVPLVLERCCCGTHAAVRPKHISRWDEMKHCECMQFAGPWCPGVAVIHNSIIPRCTLASSPWIASGSQHKLWPKCKCKCRQLRSRRSSDWEMQSTYRTVRIHLPFCFCCSWNPTAHHHSTWAQATPFLERVGCIHLSIYPDSLALTRLDWRTEHYWRWYRPSGSL